MQKSPTQSVDIDENRFEDTVIEFSQRFEELKQLARELQSFLVLIKDGVIFTGTFRCHGMMYGGTI